MQMRALLMALSVTTGPLSILGCGDSAGAGGSGAGASSSSVSVTSAGSSSTTSSVSASSSSTGAGAACGNGIIETGEQCDDTGASCGQPASGPATACKILANVAGDTCAATHTITIDPTAMNLPLFIPAPPSTPFDNTGAADDYDAVMSASCAFVPAVGASQAAPDLVFDLLPTASGQLTITLGLAADAISPGCPAMGSITSLCWNSGLFVREGDCESGVQVACDAAGGVASVTLPVTANTHYYAFVKSPDAVDVGPNLNVGSFYLKLELQ